MAGGCSRDGGDDVTTAAAIVHTAIVLALIVSYTVLSVTGHDGTPVLGILAGYLGGVGASAALPSKAGA